MLGTSLVTYGEINGSDVFNTEAALCNHHSVLLKLSSTGGVSPSAAERRCTSVKITACERGGVVLRGMMTSGLLRANNSLNCLKSCVLNTAKYDSSHSSVGAGEVWD